MTQDEIIRMAREAGGGLSCIAEPLEHPWKFSQVELERFATLVAEATKRDVITICKNWDFNVQGLIRQIEGMK